MPATKDYKCFHVTTRFYLWKSNGMSKESSENTAKSATFEIRLDSRQISRHLMRHISIL